MTDVYFTLENDGPPNPEDHPWVWYRLSSNAKFYPTETSMRAWSRPEIQWAPLNSVPPTEPAPPPEPEWVEVDGRKWRLSDSGRGVFVDDMTEDGGWHFIGSADMLKNRARVAAAFWPDEFGPVDQPTVPKKLVDWLERVEAHKPNDTGMGGRRDMAQQMLGLIQQGFFGPVEWEWVTDRIPRDDDAPVVVRKRGTDDWSVIQKPSLAAMGALHDVEWVSLPVLLGYR